jgi:hypothetical protein
LWSYFCCKPHGRLPTITFIVEIPFAAEGAAERRDNAEIRVEDEEEEKRRDPSLPLCETSAFCGVLGGEFVLLTFSLGA